MSRTLGCSVSLLSLLFSACLVDAPIVEGSDDESELGVNIASWCDTFCERSEECGIETRAACLGECVSVLQEFEDKGEICAEAGRRVVSCIDRERCAKLSGDDKCFVLEERAHCLESIADTCRSATYTSGTGAPNCVHDFGDCSNGGEYTLECVADHTGSRCACMTNGVIDGEFAADACPPMEDAIQICAWPIESVHVAPVVHAKGCVGGGSVAADQSCIQSFEQCTDGHSYGVTCTPVDRAVRCDCEIDGYVVSVYTSPDGICEFFADDPYFGRVALNYACGFSIDAPPPTAD